MRSLHLHIIKTRNITNASSTPSNLAIGKLNCFTLIAHKHLSRDSKVLRMHYLKPAMKWLVPLRDIPLTFLHPCPIFSTPPIIQSRGTKTSWPCGGPIQKSKTVVVMSISYFDTRMHGRTKQSVIPDRYYHLITYQDHRVENAKPNTVAMVPG